MNLSSDHSEPSQAAVAVVVERGKFLTITRSDSVRAPGMVCFPGGGVESDETIEEALVREMKEELDVVVVPVECLWKSKAASGIELNWWTTTLAPEQVIKPNPAEVASFQWLSIDAVLALPNLLPSNAEFFRSLNRGEFELGM